LWQHFRRKEKGGGSNDSRYPNPQFEINGQPVDYKNGEYGPDICTDFILNFIEENKETPFMAYYPMILPHCPFSPSKHHPDYDLTDPGSPTYKGDTKYFRSMVEYIKASSNHSSLKLRRMIH
jgi:arylsulfatase A